MQRYFQLVVAMAFLFIGFSAHAQEFWPGVEPWSQPYIVTPTPPFDYVADTKWRGNAWGAQAGGRVYVKFVLDWWGLGPLTASVVSDGSSGWNFEGPNTQQGNWWHGNLGTWCLECVWSFTPGSDNPEIRIDFQGSSGFGAHLEIVAIQPPPPKHLFSDETKQFLSRAALDLGLASLAFFGQSYYTAQTFPQLGGILVLMGAATGAGGLFAGYLVTQDPYNAQECAAGPYYLDPSQLPYGGWGIRYYDGSPDPLAGTAGQGAIPSLWNSVVFDAVVMEGLQRMAIACYPNEWDRGRWAAVAYSQWLRYFATDMSYLLWWFQWGGLQAIDQTYTGWDAQSTINLVVQDAWTAGWYGEYDNP